MSSVASSRYAGRLLLALGAVAFTARMVRALPALLVELVADAIR